MLIPGFFPSRPALNPPPAGQVADEPPGAVPTEADVASMPAVQQDIAAIMAKTSGHVVGTFGGTRGGEGSSSGMAGAGQLGHGVDASTAATTEGGVSSMTGASNVAPIQLTGTGPLDPETKTQVLYHMLS